MRQRGEKCDCFHVRRRLIGGRGAGSGAGMGTAVLPADVLESLSYNVTSFDDPLGGAAFPFLEQTKRAWRILAYSAGSRQARQVDETAEPHPAHTFGLDAPTLRWVNGSQVSDLYVDGMTTEQFLEATGLQLDMHKGGFVLSKRISRIMRPHFVSGFFAPDDVQIAYMAQSPAEAKGWDGAGLISRRMLRKMVLAEELPPAKRERLDTELRHAQRVEFTVMTPKGQDKGHAMVADDLRDENGRPVDFLLPRDTKTEVRLDTSKSSGRRTFVGGPTFVGLSFVHGHNDMRLDIQSLINLYPFFQEEQLLDWLKDEGDLFVQAVETGQVAEAMGRIDHHTTLEEVQAWPLREYFASGGHPMWFRSHVKSLMNQHLKRLNHSTLEKMRLPIPGGRHYVMPAAVGRRAGIKGLDVPRGHIQIDDRRGTAWVNDDDWLALPDSPKGEGIAAILGGADNDDALWLHPFTDHDGERKVLAWRSPNQVGEYVILRPTAASHALPWTTSMNDAGERGTTVYPPADSRSLPLRVDFMEIEYLGLVDPGTAGGLDEEDAYSVAVMESAISRAIANQGALGMYCNSLMLNKALYGRLPGNGALPNPPAPLEDIIDSAVKTGADLSRVVSWNYANSREILESRTPIPAILHKRLSIDWSDKEKRPPLPRASGMAGGELHWLDRLEGGVKAHIQAMQAKRDELVSQARPPQVVVDAALADSGAVELGAGLNKAYAAALRMGKGQYANVLERAKAAAENYLAHFPPERRGSILLGALASVYGKEDGGSDTAVWLSGDKRTRDQTQPDIGASPIAHHTIEALREIGLLDDIIVTKEGLVVYPAGLHGED
ncbi:MAG: hypothetical protein IPM39_20340 [Chloroflexi bacterium]|nr:hypothetical protein [Chloroflexota bacterium]